MDSYRAKVGDFRLLELPLRDYLAVDGSGDPNSSVAFTEALRALYPVAYSLKFASKDQLGQDYVVPPLEGLWYANDMSVFTSARDASRWNWTLLLAIPEWIPLGLVVTAKEHVGGRSRVSELHDAVRVEHLNEGRSVQTLHVGPFEAEAEVLERIHNDILPGNGLTPSGLHHEIYLSDIRRVVPERMRTILRQPVQLRDGVQSWPDLGSLSCPSR